MSKRMTINVPVALIQASCIFLLSIGQSSAQSLIPSRGCLTEYENGEHVYYDKFYSYNNAKEQCLSRRGTLPMPTQFSWPESLTYAISKEKKNRDGEGIWIGVTVTKSEKLGVIFTDADGLQLNDTEIQSLSLSKRDANFANLEDRRLCIVFYPSSSDQFRPQQCVSGRAKVVCRCTTGLRKRKTEEKPTVATPISSKDPVKAGQTSLKNNRQGNESSVIAKANNGIPSNGDGHFKQKGTEDKKDNSPGNTVTTILGIFLSVCLVATAYFIVRKRGKQLRDRLSRHMPYNRSHSNENGGSLRQEGCNSEDSFGYHRPIHVYEEIFGAHSNRVPSSSSPMISNGHAVATLPRLPPPEPPRTFVEIHEIRVDTDSDVGYLRPSIHRHDGIPGDVRSPPPAGRPAFEFPATPDGRSSTDGLLGVPQHELKYASVETVQTLLDGEVLSDEEYFVHDENTEAGYTNPSNNCTPIFMKLREEESVERDMSPEFIENKRNSVANPYVDVNDLTACSPPPPSGTGEYENERFLKTVMKVPPKKPRRTMKNKQKSTTVTNHLPSTCDGKKDSDIPSTSPNLPLYSKVNKTTKPGQDDEDTGYLESMNLASLETDATIGYTPMESDSSQIATSQTAKLEVATYADIPELPENALMKNHTRSHEYELVHDPSKRNNISNPVMLSTTNAALSQSSLACYEIPPEEFES